MTRPTHSSSTPGPTNHDRSVEATSRDEDPHVAKIVAVESATSLSHSLAPRQAHVTPLALFSDHALLGPLGASLLPRSPPPPLTPHCVTDANLRPTAHQHVGPAGLPLVSLTSTSTRASPTNQHGSGTLAATHPVRARRDSGSSGSPQSSTCSSHGHAPVVKRMRKTSLPADHHHHHPYRRRTSSSTSASTTLATHVPTTASSTTQQQQQHQRPHPQIPIHQLAAAPARNRHPKHLTLPTSGPHATLPTTTLLYSSATTFTACATAIVGAGARKRPRAISTPATFAQLRGTGPDAVAVGPIEAWSAVASARAFLSGSEAVLAQDYHEAEVKMEMSLV